jgi:GNAT superfamily N-acetyltransferase
MEGLRVLKGIPPERMSEVAGLLCEAFALKVEHELRPASPEQARRIIAGSIRPDLGWIALGENGEALGVAGVGVPGRRFSRMSLAMLAGEFGWLGALPRWLHSTAEGVVTRPTRRQWRVEVLAVHEATRGAGVGTGLLAAVIEAAREAGMRTVELEVVDVNERALQLYERIGFRSIFSLPTGRLTAGGGYRGVRFMRLDLHPRRAKPRLSAS